MKNIDSYFSSFTYSKVMNEKNLTFLVQFWL